MEKSMTMRKQGELCWGELWFIRKQGFFNWKICEEKHGSKNYTEWFLLLLSFLFAQINSQKFTQKLHMIQIKLLKINMQSLNLVSIKLFISVLSHFDSSISSLIFNFPSLLLIIFLYMPKLLFFFIAVFCPSFHSNRKSSLLIRLYELIESKDHQRIL